MDRGSVGTGYRAGPSIPGSAGIPRGRADVGCRALDGRRRSSTRNADVRENEFREDNQGEEAKLSEQYTSRRANRDLAYLDRGRLGSAGALHAGLFHTTTFVQGVDPRCEVFGIEDERKLAEAYRAQLGALVWRRSSQF